MASDGLSKSGSQVWRIAVLPRRLFAARHRLACVQLIAGCTLAKDTYVLPHSLLMGRIILVSTSHVAEQSAQAVRKVIEREKPDCVAVELDRLRYHALTEHQEASKRELIRALGPATGGLFVLIRLGQKVIGNRLGVIPGIDMLSGVEAARAAKIPIAFIDQDIRLTALRLRKLPKRELLRLFGYMLFGAPAALLPRQAGLAEIPSPETVGEAMDFMKLRLPTLYRTLVTERDYVMVRRLAKLSADYDTIVVVVGAGHASGIKKLLAEAQAIPA